MAELEPFGTDNAQPVFGLYNLTLTNVAAIGDGKHLKIEAAKKGKSVRMVKFRTTLDEFPHKIGDTLDFAVKLSKSTFKNKDYISAQIVDFRKSELILINIIGKKMTTSCLNSERKIKQSFILIGIFALLFINI